MRAVPTQVRKGQKYTDVPDPDADVHEAAVANIQAARVRRLVRELPDIERRVLTWRYGIGTEHLTIREIAGRLGIGKSTVSDIEARALDRLRQRFDMATTLGEAA